MNSKRMPIPGRTMGDLQEGQREQTMRCFVIISVGGFMAGLCLISPAIAQPCPGKTTPEVEACKCLRLGSSEDVLKRYVSAAATRAKREGGDKTLQSFLASQAAWTNFRNQECNAVALSWQPGSIANTMALSCRDRLTVERSHEVWENWLRYMDSTPADLPEPLPPDKPQ